MAAGETTWDDRVGRLADMVRSSARVAVLTGAGMSTASGIPDFRSPSGLYSSEDNANVFEIDAFDRNPGLYYRFARSFYPLVAKAQPNSAHQKLAVWERNGKTVEIATQNIDDLHQRAGSSRVHPVHGTILTSTCRDCHRQVETALFDETVLKGDIPRCACGGVFKPDITFFGETLPEAAWEHALKAMRMAELVLVLGTSLVVFPAAALPGYRNRAARLVLVNRDATDLDDEADLVFHESITDVFDALG